MIEAGTVVSIILDDFEPVVITTLLFAFGDRPFEQAVHWSDL